MLQHPNRCNYNRLFAASAIISGKGERVLGSGRLSPLVKSIVFGYAIKLKILAYKKVRWQTRPRGVVPVRHAWVRRVFPHLAGLLLFAGLLVIAAFSHSNILAQDT